MCYFVSIKESEEKLNTFSVITTEANPLLAKIHNTKKRMPVILSKDSDKKWLESSLDKHTISSMLRPYNESEMEAYTVPNILSKLGFNTNNSEVLEKIKYPMLSD